MRSRRRGIRLGFTFTLALCSVGRILRRGQGGVGPKDGVSQDHAAHSRGQGRILLRQREKEEKKGESLEVILVERGMDDRRRDTCDGASRCAEET